MSVYVIGDVQGCYDELTNLLSKINFNETKDQLWFAGDLVNRGPKSLETLRLVKSLNAVTVLGNHDLHLLAVARGQENKHKAKDTLDEILGAPDRQELLGWLQHRPLLHHDEESGYTLLHAGLPPQWNLGQAMECAKESEKVLQGEEHPDFFLHMYGNQPDIWSEDLEGWDRIRFIINCFTRLRFCDTEGRLNLGIKGPPGSQSPSLMPWFTVASRKTRNEKLLFGHWATVLLGNITDFDSYNVYPLDTGCIWGRELTAMRLEDGKFFRVPSQQKKSQMFE